MLSITNKNLHFIHIPRTGGTSLRKAIMTAPGITYKTRSPHHGFTITYKPKDEYVMVIRNPGTWLQSVFFYIRKIAVVRGPDRKIETESPMFNHLYKMIVGTGVDLDFENFVSKLYDRLGYNLIYDYFQLYNPLDGAMLKHNNTVHVFRMEDMNTVVRDFFISRGIQIGQIPLINHLDYQADLVTARVIENCEPKLMDVYYGGSDGASISKAKEEEVHPGENGGNDRSLDTQSDGSGGHDDSEGAD